MLQRSDIWVIKMQEKLKEMMADSSSRRRMFLCLILVGIIILIASSTIFPSGEKKQKETNQTDYDLYITELENKLESTIASIDGVGTCKVMITLQKTGENVYATDSEKKEDKESKSESDEYVIYDSDNGESPILIQAYFPNIQGVAVVCSGGDNTFVREKVTEMVSSLFNISSNRISVSKMKE